MSNQTQAYRHAEAFCKMIYSCETCKQREIVWNSRDGVTPFIIRCRFCPQGEAKHILWGMDTRVVDYVPQPGERIFVDFTPERALEAAERRMASFDGTTYALFGEERAEMVRKLAKDYARPGSPCLITVESADANRV